MWLHWEVWHDVNGPEQGVDSALVSAGMELVSLVAGTVKSRTVQFLGPCQ